MSMVKIGDLSGWLESQIGKEVKPTIDKAKYLASKIMEDLRNIRKTALALSEENKPEAVSSVETSKADIAKKFGARVVSLVDDVKPPEQMTYENLQQLLTSVKKFHRELIYAGSIWIRKLDQRYRDSVRKMELSLSDIRIQGRMLEEHLNRKYMTVRKYETLQREIETLKTLSEEITRLEDEITRTRSQRENLQVTTEELVEEKKRLENSESFLKLAQLKSAMDRAREDIVSLFRPLEKPVEKLLKLSEREKQRLDPTAASLLAEYVEDPFEKLWSSKSDYSGLKSSLNALEPILEKNLLDLKDSRIRAALKAISRIRDEIDLDELLRRYVEAKRTYESASRSEELQALQMECKEIESRQLQAKENLERVNRSLISLQARREELSKRLAQLKAGIQDSIKEITGQAIDVVGP